MPTIFKTCGSHRGNCLQPFLGSEDASLHWQPTTYGHYSFLSFDATYLLSSPFDLICIFFLVQTQKPCLGLSSSFFSSFLRLQQCPSIALPPVCGSGVWCHRRGLRRSSGRTSASAGCEIEARIDIWRWVGPLATPTKW